MELDRRVGEDLRGVGGKENNNQNILHEEIFISEHRKNIHLSNRLIGIISCGVKGDNGPSRNQKLKLNSQPQVWDAFLRITGEKGAETASQTV